MWGGVDYNVYNATGCMRSLSIYDLFLREGLRLAGQFGGFRSDQPLGDPLGLGERCGSYYHNPVPVL